MIQDLTTVVELQVFVFLFEFERFQMVTGNIKVKLYFTYSKEKKPLTTY